MKTIRAHCQPFFSTPRATTLAYAVATLAASGCYMNTTAPAGAPAPPPPPQRHLDAATSTIADPAAAPLMASAPASDASLPVAAEQIQGAGEAVIVFRSTKSETVLGEVTGRSFASASGLGGTATADGVSWTNLCEGPCRYRLVPGYHELHVGAGLVASTKGFTLRPGENRIVGDRGSPGLVLGGAFLVSFAFIGGGFLGAFGSWPVGLAVGGAGIIGGSVMMWSGWPSLEQDREPASSARPTGIAVRGTF